MNNDELFVDALAQEIRRVDGGNNLGAGALAEALMPFLQARSSDAELVEALEKAKSSVLDANRNGFTRGIDCLETINTALAKHKPSQLTTKENNICTKQKK